MEGDIDEVSKMAHNIKNRLEILDKAVSPRTMSDFLSCLGKGENTSGQHRSGNLQTLARFQEWITGKQRPTGFSKLWFNSRTTLCCLCQLLCMISWTYEYSVL